MGKMKVGKGKSFRSVLVRLKACDEALAWVGRKSLRCAWRTCEKGDWMLWLAARVCVDQRALVLAACECARLALVHVAVGDERPRIAIETAEAWARGESGVTLAAVSAAAIAAADAANAAYAAATRAAVDAATAAYYAASDAATAAYYAASASANADVSYAARTATLRQCADIVRKYIDAKDFAERTPA